MSSPGPRWAGPDPLDMSIQPCLIDLSDRAKFRLTGADRERYLNGQVTNQVSRATADAAIEACVCNAKGKLEGVVSITRAAEGGDFMIDAPAQLRESLFARLGRYIIADDCELEDVTEEFGLIHALGEVPDLPGARWRASDRIGIPGRDLWVTGASRGAILAGDRVLDRDEVEEIRIRHGVPAWGADLSGDILPAEAGLDRRAVDFHKGCYVGQEVVSRLQSVGRVNRVLVLVETTGRSLGVLSGEAEVMGDSSLDDDGSRKAVGRVTSVAPGGRLALALVKRDWSAPETKLVLRDGKDNIEAVVRAFESGDA